MRVTQAFGFEWRPLWRRNGPQGPVYEPRVAEAGSRWSWVSPFVVK